MKKVLGLMLSLFAGAGMSIITESASIMPLPMDSGDHFICGLVVFCTGVILTFGSRK